MELVGLVIFVLATALSTLRLALPLGRRDMRRVVIANGAAGVTYLAWVGVLLSLHRPSVGLVLLGAALATLLIVPLTGAPGRAGQRPRRAPGTHRDAVRFGLPASLGEVLALASYRADLVLLGAFTSSRQVGLYATAAALSELIWLAPNAVAIVLLPHVAGHAHGRDTARAVRLMVPITAIAGIALVVLGHPILRAVFGPSFQPAAVALGPLVLAAVLLGAWKILVADLVGRGFSRYRASTAFMGLCVMVASDLVLIPRFDIVGAGVGSALGYGTAALSAALAWRAATRGCLADLVVPRRADVTAMLGSRRGHGAYRDPVPAPVAPIGEVSS
jgi:O-antigen/teichoic acid export membrane protein